MHAPQHVIEHAHQHAPRHTPRQISRHSVTLAAARRARWLGRMLPAACFALALGTGAAHSADYAHPVAAGDTIISITQRLLQDPRDYIKVQRHNRLTNAQARALKPGSALRIPQDLLRREAAAARVVSVNGAAQSAATQAGTAVPLQNGQELRAGAVVTTGADGSVALRMADDSLIRMPPQSALRLDRVNRIVTGHNFEQLMTLLRGRAEAEVKTVASPGRFEMTTPVASLGIRGTQFRASYDAAEGAARGEVLEGRVAFDGVAADAGAAQQGGGGAAQTGAAKTAAAKTAPGNPGKGRAALGRSAKDSADSAPPGVVLAAGMGSVADKSGVPSAPRALLAAPALALQSADLQERAVVRFPLQALAGAKAYRAQITRAGSLDVVLREDVFTAPEVKFGDLDDGSYTLALRAIDGVGLEGKSLVQGFRLKARPEPPLTQTPAPNGKARGEAAQFVWGESADGNSYRLQLARDGAFRDLVQDEKSLKTATLTSRALPPGAYFWRVGSIKPDGDIGPWGDAQRFTMLPPTAPPQASEANGQMQFAWSGEPGQRFLVQIAREREFTSFLHNAEITQSQLAIRQPPAGVYFIRIRATDADGFVGPFTPPQRFEVINRLTSGDAANVNTGDGSPVRLR